MGLLEDRETRVDFQNKLQEDGLTIAVLKVNWVGANKSNKDTAYIVDELNAHVNGYQDHHVRDNSEGKIYYYVFDVDPVTIKAEMVHLEETHHLGRLVDIDVYQNGEQFKRDKLRKCIICDGDAFVCMRAKKHTEKEVLKAMKTILKDYKK